MRLANLYAEWRRFIAEDVAGDIEARPGRRVSATTFATLVQAVVHGLAIQRAADPQAYDSHEMLDLVLDVLGTYLRPDNAPAPPDRGDRPSALEGER